MLAGLIEMGNTVRAAPVNGGWLEVDTVSDLETYEAMLRDGAVGDFYHLPQAVS